MKPYVPSFLHPRRRLTHVVKVGDISVGGDHPIAIQSMTTPATTNTQATADQIERLVDVGCEIVRVTTPAMVDVENLPNIRAELKRRKIFVPLVADVHFLPKVALEACNFVEKVRINPGNFADRKRFEIQEYSDQEYREELDRIRDTFLPIIHRAKENGVALRIGANHGSLSDRIMNRYGDTPFGMVESALEFVRFAEAEGFKDIILSMKASNTQVMVQAYRLLVEEMNKHEMTYPLHLGVTEAGDGEDGRIKSSIGIGSLLADGLGDTIRVSLTEDPEFEIPVARMLRQHYFTREPRHQFSGEIDPSECPWNFREYERRISNRIPSESSPVGEKQLVRVRTKIQESELEKLSTLPPKLEQDVEIIHMKLSEFKPEVRLALKALSEEKTLVLELDSKKSLEEDWIDLPFHQWVLDASSVWLEGEYLEKLLNRLEGRSFWIRLETESQISTALEVAKEISKKAPVGIEIRGRSLLFLGRQLVSEISKMGLSFPIHLSYIAASKDLSDETLLRASIEIGGLLNDGIGDSIEINSTQDWVWNHRLAFNILQATRLRMVKTEFIACPSCGRTLFNLQETTARIRFQTGHLKGVKIAIMGCIVNGPGEMADADFGYVGSGPGHINLYVGKECVERKIPQSEADERLIQLIKKHDRWTEPTA